MVKFNKTYFFDESLVHRTGYKKKQIVLLNTNYPVDDFLTKISLRYNKKYTKIPAYTIDLEGNIFQHMNPEDSSQIFENSEQNKASIPIALENIGWLDFHEKTNTYTDWRGQPYFGDVIQKNWRGKKYWTPYSDTQIGALLDLLDYLCVEYSIEPMFIGHNVLIDNAKNFNGILNRSNFSKNHYDLTPAFDFNKLKKQKD